MKLSPPSLQCAFLIPAIVWIALALPAKAQPFAYITNAGDGTVSVLDTLTNTVVDTVLVGNVPNGVAVHPDGSKVYVAHNFDNTVAVIDTSHNTVVDTVENLGQGMFGVDVHPDGSTVYVAASQNDVVILIDTATNTVVDTVPVGDAPIAFGDFIGPVPLGGAVTGLNPAFMFGLCINRTQPQAVFFILLNETSWECEDQGLNVAFGDVVDMFVRGGAQLPGPVGGAVTGLNPAFMFGVCINRTQPQAVFFILLNETSWDCENEGLNVAPDDVVDMFVRGVAQ